MQIYVFYHLNPFSYTLFHNRQVKIYFESIRSPYWARTQKNFLRFHKLESILCVFSEAKNERLWEYLTKQNSGWLC